MVDILHECPLITCDEEVSGLCEKARDLGKGTSEMMEACLEEMKEDE